jgi:CubicO group peptidase (beta-lactamase class C family)
MCLLLQNEIIYQMKNSGSFIVVLALSIVITSFSCSKAGKFEDFPLAEEHNVDGAMLAAAFHDFRQVEGALSLLVCRDGITVAEDYTNYKTYGADSLKNIMSVTKTFTGVLVGLAIERGFIGSVNDPLSKYLAGVVTFPDEIKAGITIDQCLKMSFGHSWNGTSGSSLFEECFFESNDNLQYIIDLPLVSTPGAIFNYSDGASHLLSAIIQEATGMKTSEFAREYLFAPLGIKRYRWAEDDRGYPIGAAYLSITPADMIKFGNLILNDGVYNNQQVVPESWIKVMTTKQISTGNDVLYGPEYGYQIWLGSSAGKQYYMAMGWGGQFIFVLPQYNSIISATCWTSGLTDAQAGDHWTRIIRIIVEKIFPAIK